MLTRISETQAQQLIKGVKPQIYCDCDFCKHYSYNLLNGDVVEYCRDVVEDEQWNLIDSKPIPRLAP